MYDTHWGLTGRPFQLTPDPRFWFETATHRKAMAYLGYGLAQGEGFIVITGDIGAGKTTLVAHLLDTLDRQHLSPIRIVSTAIEADDLLRIVAGQLGVEVDGLPKAQLLTAIERGLHAVARSGRRTLMIVDEAQALPVSALEELRMLSNFQAGGHALLQIVLLGQPEFRDRLHGSDRLDQLRQRVIAIHHLDPMERHEVADYIAHRLSVVGWTGRPDFAEDAFPALFHGSAGVPRRLNLLAGRVMLHAAIEDLALIDARVVATVLNDLDADLPMAGLETAARAAPLPITPPAAPVAATASAAPGWFGSAVAPEPVVELPQPEPVEDARPRDPVEEAHRLDPVEETVQPEPVAETPEPALVEEAALPDPAPIADAPAAPASDIAIDLLARVALLEDRVDSQDAALRRVLTLLVDWVEADEPRPRSVNAPVPIRPATSWHDAA